MSFVADVEKFISKTGLRADIVLRKISFDIFAGVVRKTPVDTGRARASWTIAVNQIDLSVAPEGAAYAAKEADAMMTLQKAEWGDVIYISNNLPYIEPLNAGHSQQAPAKFVEMAVEEVIVQFAQTVGSLP